MGRLSNPKYTLNKDVVIILAGGINPDGSLPDIPKLRVGKGVELFKSGVAPRIIMSGRCGFWIDDKFPKTEAQAMEEYAISLGVPESYILKEEDSKDTVGNAFFCRKNFLDPNNWKRVCVVTSEYHMPRSEYLFNKLLGTDFEIDFVSVNSQLSAEELSARNQKENRTLEEIKKWLDPFETGDMAEFERTLYTRHPGYAKNPEISKEELKKMLGRE